MSYDDVHRYFDKLNRIEDPSEPVFIDKDFIVIHSQESKLLIQGDRCNTHEKILAWIPYLCDQSWITPLLIKNFIETAEIYHKLKRASF
jgi:hypothetical protein